jgi:hypothetical protein
MKRGATRYDLVHLDFFQTINFKKYIKGVHRIPFLDISKKLKRNFFFLTRINTSNFNDINNKILINAPPNNDKKEYNIDNIYEKIKIGLETLKNKRINSNLVIENNSFNKKESFNSYYEEYLELRRTKRKKFKDRRFSHARKIESR